MRLLTTWLLVLGFGLFLTGESWLWSKKMSEPETAEEIDYLISGDSIRIQVPIAIPYLSHSLENNTSERVIFVENAYFQVARSYFKGDTLYTEGYRIQPSRQEIFSILGQLVQLGQEKEPSPIDQALELFKQVSKFHQPSNYVWIQWFWTDLMVASIDFSYMLWQSLSVPPLSPPPCLVN